MAPLVRTSREVQGSATRVRPGVTKHAPPLPDTALSVMDRVEEGGLAGGSVDMDMDQDVAIMGDSMAITEDLVATTEDLVATTEDLVETTEDLVAIMGDSIMGAVLPTADMDRIVILAATVNITTVNTTTVNTTTANITTASSQGPWPVS